MEVGVSVLALIFSGVLAGQGVSPPPPSPSPPTTSIEIQVRARFAPPAAHKPAAYELVRGHVTFKAVVAGRDVWALLDTGAERSLIDTSLAADAGLQIGAPQGTVRTSTGSSIPKRRVSDVQISIPDQLEIQSPAVAGLDMAALSAAMGRKIEFVLGADFLSRLAFKLDPAKRTLDLYPSGVLQPPAGFPSLPLKDGYRIEIDVDGKPVVVQVDLGAASALTLQPNAWRRVGPANASVERGETVGVDGLKQAADFGVLPVVSLGVNRYTNVRTKIFPWPSDDTEGAIGMDLLDRLFIVLDAQAGKMWLAPPAGMPRG
jgi:predicted aspartyl protease